MLIAPRISLRLIRELERLDDPAVSFAEISRRLGERADELGIPRPSYQRVRVLIHELRQLKRRTPSVADVAVDVALRRRPPDAVVDRLANIPLPKK